MRYLIKEMVLYNTKEQIEIFDANDYNDAMRTLRRNTICTLLIDDNELIQYNEIKSKYPQITGISQTFFIFTLLIDA